jgi:hypothetical protein
MGIGPMELLILAALGVGCVGVVVVVIVVVVVSLGKKK